MSALVFRDMLVTVLLNALIALPVFGLVRGVIRARRWPSTRSSAAAGASAARDGPLGPARAGGLSVYLDGTNRRSLTPQLALPVAMIGGIALVAFAVIFFRLWYLQVLSGDKYQAEANDNRVREIKVQAPRGEIVDRNGTVLVDNRTGLAVQVTPDKLPGGPRERRGALPRLGRVLGIRARADRAAASTDQLKALPYSRGDGQAGRASPTSCPTCSRTRRTSPA